MRPRFRRRVAKRGLLQSLDEVKIREHAVIAEDAGLRVRRHENRPNRLHTCGIGRHELLPQGALSGIEVEPIHLFDRDRTLRARPEDTDLLLDDVEASTDHKQCDANAGMKGVEQEVVVIHVIDVAVVGK